MTWCSWLLCQFPLLPLRAAPHSFSPPTMGAAVSLPLLGERRGRGLRLSGCMSRFPREQRSLNPSTRGPLPATAPLVTLTNGEVVPAEGTDKTAVATADRLAFSQR